jgi:hypothetical protein
VTNFIPILIAVAGLRIAVLDSRSKILALVAELDKEIANSNLRQKLDAYAENIVFALEFSGLTLTSLPKKIAHRRHPSRQQLSTWTIFQRDTSEITNVYAELPGRLRLTAEGERNRVLPEEGIRRKQV